METTTAERVDKQAAGRTITPRRALPSGRALVGAFLVTVATLGAFVLATGGDDGPDTEYLVTTVPLQAGDTITLADVRFEPMTLSDELAGTALNSTVGLEGATVLRDFRPGELIDVADVIAGVGGTEDGTVHEITMAMPLARTPTSLVVGDRVTIFATIDDVTYLAVEDARVISVDREPDLIGGRDGVLTLAVDDPEVVQRVAHVTAIGDLTVVRSTRAIDDVFPTDPEATS